MRDTAVLTNEHLIFPGSLLFFFSTESNFLHTNILSFNTASWQLEDLLADDLMQSTRHLSMIPPVHLCAPRITFKSNSNQIKFKAVSNVILPFFSPLHDTGS